MKDWHKLKPDLFKKQPYYLTGCDGYLGEVDFRYNERSALDVTDAMRCDAGQRALAGVVGKRVTNQRINSAQA